MIKNSNTRITITITKKQFNWLTELCEEKNMKMSKLISWLLYQKSIDVEHTKNLLENPKEELEIYSMTEEEFIERFNKYKYPGQKEDDFRRYILNQGYKITQRKNS